MNKYIIPQTEQMAVEAMGQLLGESTPTEGNFPIVGPSPNGTEFE